MGKVNMKKIFLLVIISAFLFLTTTCVYDTMSCMRIINRTNDTILVCSARYNNFDSVEYCIGLDMLPIEFDDMKKIITSNDNILVLPDSIGRYWELGFRNNFFRHNEDNKGYFFIIKLETVKDYTWEEIRSNKLYETMIITREMLNKNGWKVDYYSKENKN